MQYNDPWPYVGEIDVYEGVNDRTWGQPNVRASGFLSLLDLSLPSTSPSLTLRLSRADTSDGCFRNASVPKTGDASNLGRSCSVSDGSGASLSPSLPLLLAHSTLTLALHRPQAALYAISTLRRTAPGSMPPEEEFSPSCSPRPGPCTLPRPSLDARAPP